MCPIHKIIRKKGNFMQKNYIIESLYYQWAELEILGISNVHTFLLETTMYFFHAVIIIIPHIPYHH